MIQLQVTDLPDLLRQHYASLGPLVQGRAQLFIDVLNAGCLRQYLPTTPALRAQRYGLHGAHLNTCVDTLRLRAAGERRLTNERVFEYLTGTASLRTKPSYIPLAKTLIRLLREITRSTELLLTGEPAALEDFMLRTRSRYSRLISGDAFVPAAHALLAQVFDYDHFTERPQNEWGAFQLTQSLGVNVCPYCNHNYTLTVYSDAGSGKPRAIRPHIDHFFSQARNPLLAVSFYNLIPCCSVCNSSLKGTQVFTLQTHVHPYLHGFGTEGRFRFTYVAPLTGQLEPTVEIRLEIDRGARETQISGSVTSFLLANIYQYHTDIVREMLFKKRAYSTGYLAVLAQQYRELNLSPEQLYQQAFSAYLREEEFGRRPLSKLIRDLALDMGMLPDVET